MEGKRDLLISAGMRVFPRVGFHAATVDDILKEANVARSTFYSYFSNKREIYTDTVKVLVDWVVDTLKTGVDSIIERFDVAASSRPPVSELERSIARLMIVVYKYLAEHAGLAQMFLNELVGIDDEMTAFFIQFEDSLTHHFERLVRFGEKIGVVETPDPRRAANFVVCGLIHMGWKVSAGQHVDEIEDICSQYVAFHLRGLLKRPAPQP